MPPENHVGQRFLVAASLDRSIIRKSPAVPAYRQSGSDRQPGPDSLVISFAAIFNEQIRQVVCRKTCACCADGCVQISRSPAPHRGRASATNSRGLAKATSRMDRARRRVSHVRFLRGAPEAAPRNFYPVGTGRNSFAARARSLLPSSLMQSGRRLAVESSDR